MKSKCNFTYEQDRFTNRCYYIAYFHLQESKRGQEKEVQKPIPRASCSNQASLVSVHQASPPCQLPVWLPSASSGAPVSRLCPATSLTTAVTVILADLLSVSHALGTNLIWSIPCSLKCDWPKRVKRVAVAATAILSYYSNSKHFLSSFIHLSQVGAESYCTTEYSLMRKSLCPSPPSAASPQPAYCSILSRSDLRVQHDPTSHKLCERSLYSAKSSWLSLCGIEMWEMCQYGLRSCQLILFYLLKRKLSLSSVNVFCSCMEQIADSFVHSADSNQPLSEKCLDVP